jgi:hypothetical protein
MSFAAVDCAADEGMFSMRFYVFLDCDYLIAELLKSQIVEVAGVYEFEIVTVVVGLIFGD